MCLALHPANPFVFHFELDQREIKGVKKEEKASQRKRKLGRRESEVLSVCVVATWGMGQ